VQDLKIKEECILKSKNKLCLFKKLSVFYKSCLKTFVSHLVCLGSTGVGVAHCAILIRGKKN
jgi:hypothetical protein